VLLPQTNLSRHPSLKDEKLTGTTMDDLDSQILDILRNATAPLSARSIAEFIRKHRSLNVDKSDVNQHLYRSLSAFVTKDSEFRWSLKGNTPSSDRTVIENAHSKDTPHPTHSEKAVITVIEKHQMSLVPKGFGAIQPGNTFITRHVKKHASAVYVLMQWEKNGRYRRGRYMRRPQRRTLVCYYAPQEAIQKAVNAWTKHNEGLARKQERAKRISLLGSAAAKAREIFLSLDELALARVLRAYRREHGASSYNYAQQTYQEWKNGTKNMSSEISERLLMLLPAHLNFSQQYDIFEVLWRDARPKEFSRVTINSHQGIDNAIATVMASLKAGLERDFPQEVKEIVVWLAEDDAQIATTLARQFNEREHQIIVSMLRRELEVLLTSATHAERVLDLPGNRISINVIGGYRK